MSITATRGVRIRHIRSRLAALTDVASRTWWEFGSLLAEVKRDELWRDDGADSFTGWLASVGWERETARKAMLVAANFTPEMVEAYGTEKLAAAVGYLDATAKEERPGELGALQVRFAGKSGRYETVPFQRATVAQVKAATKLVNAGRREKVRPDSMAQYDAKVEALSAAMPAAPAGLVRAQRVAVSLGTDGRPAVTFHAVPLDELEAFVAAVRQTMLGGV